MKIDPKMLKEINSAVDGFVKKNKDSIENAKLIDKQQKQISKLEKRIADMDKQMTMMGKHLDDTRARDDKILLKRIEKLEKSRK